MNLKSLTERLILKTITGSTAVESRYGFKSHQTWRIVCLRSGI
ncbi:hypothetical protein ACXFAU_17510 [Paenibacillus glucanolyticus]